MLWSAWTCDISNDSVLHISHILASVWEVCAPDPLLTFTLSTPTSNIFLHLYKVAITSVLMYIKLQNFKKFYEEFDSCFHLRVR